MNAFCLEPDTKYFGHSKCRSEAVTHLKVLGLKDFFATPPSSKSQGGTN
jgi:hypothetical protein